MVVALALQARGCRFESDYLHMTNETQCLSATIKPKFPPPIYIEEGGVKFCKCGSSMKMQFFFIPRGCYQPNCENYWGGFPCEGDYNENYASYFRDEWNYYF